MNEMLSRADVERLLADGSPAARVNAAAKIALQYRGGRLSPDERRIAEDIIGVMARDAQVRVRAALADKLKDYPDLAHGVALALAADVDEVSLPVIRFSSVLTDDDLLDIVRTQGTAKQTAVASRASVSERVADALADTGKEEVVAALIANEGATIGEATFGKVLAAFGTSEPVTATLVARAELPVSVAERLVYLVAEHLQERLVAKHAIAPEIAAEIAMQSRERATLGLLAPGAKDRDVHVLAAQLHEAGRLTPSIVLRALCMGDLAFFETSVAVLAGVSTDSARSLIHDPGPLGLPAVLARAGLPDEMLAVFRAAVDVARETDYDGGTGDRERFRRRMIERVLTYIDDRSADMDDGDADYLLTRLAALDTELARGQPSALPA